MYLNNRLSGKQSHYLHRSFIFVKLRKSGGSGALFLETVMQGDRAFKTSGLLFKSFLQMKVDIFVWLRDFVNGNGVGGYA